MVAPSEIKTMSLRTTPRMGRRGGVGGEDVEKRSRYVW
jgi:hypothetical protein